MNHKFLINIDAGEGEADSTLDLELLNEADALNLALGGHAGDIGWTRTLAKRALELERRVHLHPGYPDREGFGRRELALPWDTLAKALTEQRRVLPEITTCKFHGALYNRANVDHELAQRLVDWCLSERVLCLLTPDKSELARVADDAGLDILREGFVDRAYQIEQGRLVLAPRSEPQAVFTEIEPAMRQAISIIQDHTVTPLNGPAQRLACDTLCVHGDGPHAVDLARRLREWRELA